MRDQDGKIKAPHLLTNQGEKGGRREIRKIAGLAKTSTPSLGKLVNVHFIY